MAYDRKNLVALVYASNTCYTQVVEVDNKSLKSTELEINEKRGRWSVMWGGDRESYLIGENRHCTWGSRGGVIGIYDRTKIEHLNSMVSASKEATRDQSHYALQD